MLPRTGNYADQCHPKPKAYLVTRMIALNKTVAIIAGNGSLPVELAVELEGSGSTIYILGISGEAEPSIEQFDHDYIHIGQVSRMFKLLRLKNVRDVTLAGGIVHRPSLREMKLDIGAFIALPRALGWMLSGDNAVLVGVINGFKERGFIVRGAHELVPDLLVKPGANTKKKPGAQDLVRIELGISVARALGQYDVGQAVVVIEKACGRIGGR